MSEGFRLIEHTADIGIEARAETLPDLFVAAARGLREVLSASLSAPPDQAVSVALDGGDPGELLVNWLNEIVFLLESRHLFPVDFSIDSLSDEHLEGRIRGFRLDRAGMALDREVKAATYHQLRVEKGDDAWHARVYLDL